MAFWVDIDIICGFFYVLIVQGRLIFSASRNWKDHLCVICILGGLRGKEQRNVGQDSCSEEVGHEGQTVTQRGSPWPGWEVTRAP